MRESYYREKIDDKAYFVQLLKRIPEILIIGLVGAIIGSGLYLLIMVCQNRVQYYQKSTEYYINFTEGILEAKDHFNAYTWEHSIIGSDEVLGEAMKKLGSDYDRQTVSEMISITMISDVRYLTVNVTGTDSAEIEKISDALSDALARFGSIKDEFEEIYAVRNNEVEPIVPQYFTLRAAELGFVVALILAILIYSIVFGLGDSIYTKKEVTNYLGIPALGLWYKSGNMQDGVQETQLKLILERLASQLSSNADEIVCVDIDDKHSSEAFVDEYNKIYEDKNTKLTYVSYPRRNTASYDKIRNAKGAVIAIPFGTKNRLKAEDVINELKLQECNILGAVIVNVDNTWMKIYTGKKGNPLLAKDGGSHFSSKNRED